MESNWRYNLYRYGLGSLWEVGPSVKIARAYVRGDAGSGNYIWLREKENTTCNWAVPPVVTADLKIHVLPMVPATASVHPTIATDFYPDQPLVTPWQVRIDPS